MIRFEIYVSDGWIGIYRDFRSEIPTEARYWMVNGQNLFEKQRSLNMADAHYMVLFDRIRAQYRRENWLSPEGRRIDPGLRLVEKLADREDLQRRYYWTDEQGTEYLHRQFYDYDERAGREHIVEVNIPVPYIAYLPTTEEQLRATEETLGFPLPPLLRALYAEIANGGVGPVEGIMGVIGGSKIIMERSWMLTCIRRNTIGSST
jgi:hypothetical protein